ncbi:interferon lambda-3-like [Scyliorhinus torazame]|uniref:interferon lambda-3-like n=1 Tax=Scyliorhinus torazame TaxID=75743 RepID=UPI003B5C7A7C
MEMRTRSVLLTVAVSLLVCGPLVGAAGEKSDGRSCDLSIFRTPPPVVMRTFQHFQNHYVRIRSPRYTTPLVASLDVLTGLSVPERRVLVRAEFEIFTQVLGNVTEETLGVLWRKVCNTLNFITDRLTQCVMMDDLNTDQYSTELSLLLKRLKELKDDPASSSDRAVGDLVQLLNEHLTCVAARSSR